jgi:hypothetical protein
MNNLAHRMTNQLEIDVRAFGRDLYNDHLAYLFKVPEEMQQTPCDFFGWTPLGRAILIECKQVRRPRLPIGSSNGLQAHQWNALELAFRCGAYSYLIWRNGDETAVLTFAELSDFAKGMRSIPWTACCGFKSLGWQDVIRRDLRVAP